MLLRAARRFGNQRALERQRLPLAQRHLGELPVVWAPARAVKSILVGCSRCRLRSRGEQRQGQVGIELPVDAVQRDREEPLGSFGAAEPSQRAPVLVEQLVFECSEVELALHGLSQAPTAGVADRARRKRS